MLIMFSLTCEEFLGGIWLRFMAEVHLLGYTLSYNADLGQWKMIQSSPNH